MGAMASHEVFEPENIRALAHPLRLELLGYLRDVHEATATQCAEHVGESVASCSFHLGILGKYGYIERAPQRGREKPWRPVAGDQWEMRPAFDVPGSLSAVSELASMSVLREGERLRRFFGQSDREDPAWVDASVLTTASFWATVDEMAQLGRELAALTQRFSGREFDPSQRPEGARRGRLFAAVNPDPLHEAGDG